MNELYHYGVKGMRWGVRKDPDRKARRIEKKYYTHNRGYLEPNKKAYKINRRRIDKAERMANAVKINAEKIHGKEIAAQKARYFEANKKNNLHYLNEREKWFKNEGEYKNKDYYQFKQISASKWEKTKAFKQENEALDALRNIYKEAAKAHPSYDKSFEIFERSWEEHGVRIESINTGKYVVNNIMAGIMGEAHSKQKHFLDDKKK